MLGSILSDGRAVFYPESASYLSLSSLNGPPGYSNGVAVLMTLGGAGGEAEQPTISTLPCTLSTTVSLVCRRSKPTACFLFVTLGGARVTACSLALAKPEQASSCPGLAMRLKTHSAARPNHWRSPSPSGGRAVSLSRQPLQHSVMRVPDSRTSQLQPNSKKIHTNQTPLSGILPPRRIRQVPGRHMTDKAFRQSHRLIMKIHKGSFV